MRFVENYLESNTQDSNVIYPFKIEMKESNPPIPYAAKSILEKLMELSSLDNDWNSYGAKKPTDQAILASALLSSYFTDDTPVPYIFPVPNGNIQIEWNKYGRDIEIEIESFSKFYVVYENLENPGQNWDYELKQDLTLLMSIISELSTLHSKNHRLAQVANG